MPPTSCPSCGTAQEFVFDAQAGGLACTACGSVVEDYEVLGRDDQVGTSAGRGSFRIGQESIQSRSARLVAAQTDNAVNRTDYARRKEHDWDIWMRGVLNACGLGSLLPVVQHRFQQCRAYVARKVNEQEEMDERGQFVPEHERVAEVTWGRQAELYGLGCAYIAASQARSDLNLTALLSRADRPATESPQIERAIVNICRWIGPAEVEFGPELLLDRIHKYTHDTLQQPKPQLLGSTHHSWNKLTLKWARTADLKQAKLFASDLITLGRSVSLTKGREPAQVAVAAFMLGVEAATREKSPSLADWFDHLGNAFGGKAFTTGERYREFEAFLLDKIQDYQFLVPAAAPTKAKKKRPELHLYSAVLVKMLAANLKKEEPQELQLPAGPAEDGSPPGQQAAEASDSRAATQASADLRHTNLAPASTPAERPSALFDARRLDKHGKRPAKYMRERPGPIKRARLLDDIVGAQDGPLAAQSPSPSEYSAGTSLEGTQLTYSIEETAGKVIKVVLPHEVEAAEMARLVLQGCDPTKVLEGKAELDERGVSRLERIIIARGGQIHGHVFDSLVEDDELFGEGELDGLLRTDEEMVSYSRTARWRDIEAAHREYTPRPERPSRSRRSASKLNEWDSKPKSKVTSAMKAFADQLLKGEEDGKEVIPDFGAFQAVVGADEDEDEWGGEDGETMALYDQVKAQYGGGGGEWDDY